jgi:hypothetical protein
LRRLLVFYHFLLGENHAWSGKMIEKSAISRAHLTKRCLDAEHDALDAPIDDDHHVFA